MTGEWEAAVEAGHYFIASDGEVHAVLDDDAEDILSEADITNCLVCQTPLRADGTCPVHG